MRGSLAVKPFIRLNNKPKRLPERKAVTIIAGFRCPQGIVLCADTLETIEGRPGKRNVPKLRFEPFGVPHMGDGLAAAFCGAGNGPFIDKLVENAWEDVQTATNLDEACALIEESIKGTYKIFGQIYQPGYLPSSDLLYGVKMYGSSRLFFAHGPLVNRKDTYETAGAGYDMAEFLAGRMYHENLTLRQCVILAAYILFQAKEHVDGCGGDSHIAILRNEGTSGKVESNRIDVITDLLRFADKQIGHLLIDAANLSSNKTHFQLSAKLLSDSLTELREFKREEFEASLKGIDAVYEILAGQKAEAKDFFGLPITGIPEE
jgi:hypothetical protein